MKVYVLGCLVVLIAAITGQHWTTSEAKRVSKRSVFPGTPEYTFLQEMFRTVDAYNAENNNPTTFRRDFVYVVSDALKDFRQKYPKRKFDGRINWSNIANWGESDYGPSIQKLVGLVEEAYSNGREETKTLAGESMQLISGVITYRQGQGKQFETQDTAHKTVLKMWVERKSNWQKKYPELFLP